MRTFGTLRSLSKPKVDVKSLTFEFIRELIVEFGLRNETVSLHIHCLVDGHYRFVCDIENAASCLNSLSIFNSSVYLETICVQYLAVSDISGCELFVSSQSLLNKFL